MADWLSPIAQSLQGQYKQDLALNPAYAGGIGLSQMEAPVIGNNFWSAFLPQVALGGASGLAKGYGRHQVDEEQKLRADALARYAATTDATERKSLLATDENLKDLAPQLQIAEMQRNSEIEDQIRKAGLLKGNDARKFTIKPDGSITIDDSQRESTRSPGLFGNIPGAVDVDKLYNDTYNQAIEAGESSARASQRAMARIEPFKRDSTQTLKKSAENLAKGETLSGVADQTQSAMSKLGDTGALFPETRMMLKRLAASVAPWDTPEYDKQLAGAKTLASIAPEIVSGLKTPGAVSDYEHAQFLKAAPSIGATPAENQAFIDRARQLSDIYREYSDFTNALTQEYGSTADAGRLWDAYKRANPIFTADYSSVNPNRQSWREFAAAGGFEQALNGSGPRPGSTGSWEGQGDAATDPRAAAIAELKRRGKI